MSAHFGRCPSFTIVDLEDGKVVKQETITNPGHQPGLIPKFLNEKGVQCIVAGGMGGVSIKSGQLVAEKKVKIVLTGKVGPNAAQTLESAGIEVILDVEGTAKEAIERFKKGELKPTKGPNADEKAGLNK